MKTKILISGIVFFGIATLVAIAWRSLPDNHSSTLHREASNAVIVSQNEKPGGFLSNSIAESSLNAVTDLLKETRGGLTVEIRGYDLNPDYPTVTVCADLPSVADWLPRFSAIYKSQPVDISAWMLIDPDNTAYQAANRCYLVMLPAGVFDTNPSGKLVFSLDYFEMSLP